MNNKVLLFFCFSLFVTSLFSQNKLITIYNKDCSYCHKFLNEVHPDTEVTKLLANYNHQLVEINTEEGRKLLDEYEVRTYPTQVVISEDEIITLGGFLTVKQEIQFLQDPSNFKGVQKKKRLEN